MTTYHVIGQSVTRADADKVTGEATYTADVQLPGMLWGKMLRSPFAYARITRIDTSEAKRLPGVQAVLTGKDVSGVRYGRRLFDIPVLCEDTVLFIGDKVAAVAAESAEIAQRALDLIQVEYEELTPVFDPEEAMREGVTPLHPDVNSYLGLPEKLAKPSNVFVRNEWKKGDLAKGFAEADVVVENTYRLKGAFQAYLEPHSCVVWIDPAGKTQVWASNKAPYAARQHLSTALGIPESQINFNHVYIGGDFGGKGSLMDVPLAYFLAKASGRPVKIVRDYVEELMASNPRHATVIRMKTGAKRDGTLVAHEAHVVFNSGAYGGFKPGVNLTGARNAGGPYRIPNVWVDAVQVYTNTIPGGHMRSPGEPQAVFALESQWDEVAKSIGMDPLEFRLKNVIGDGDETAVGGKHTDVKARETLLAAAQAGLWGRPKGPNVGRGIALGDRSPAGGETNAAVTLHPDGTVTAWSSFFDQGTGTYTTVRQVVAEELGLDPERVTVQAWNTDEAQFDSGIGGSRATRLATQAAYQAAREARANLIALATSTLGWPEGEIAYEDGHLRRTTTDQRTPWLAVVSKAGKPVTGMAHIQDTARVEATAFTAQVAEVQVDPETGQVRLLRFTSAHDVGQVLNPVGHQGQINGGVVMGIGYALMEELVVEDGRVTNVTFGDYKIPTARDIPELHTVLVPSESGVGPYKIKGIGENPVVPVAAAIANAVADALGTRIFELPITAERVWKAMREGEG